MGYLMPKSFLYNSRSSSVQFLKVNAIARLAFKLIYYDVAGQHFSHDATRIPLVFWFKVFLLERWFILSRLRVSEWQGHQ